MKPLSNFCSSSPKLIILFLLLGEINFLFAQSVKLDSLKSLTSSPGVITPHQHIDLINKLSYELRVSYPDIAMSSSQQALRLSKETNYRIGESDAHVTLGLLYWLLPEIDKSLEHGLKALRLSDSLGYKKGSIEAN